MEMHIHLSDREPRKHGRMSGKHGTTVFAYRVVYEEMAERAACNPYAFCNRFNRTAEEAAEWLRGLRGLP